MASLPGNRGGRSSVHESFLRYAGFRWLWIAVLIVAIAGLAYGADNPKDGASGGTALGYTLGTIGAGLILWLTMLGLRKRAITPGRWSLKAWTSAHVYLGLALIVIGTLHTGFHFGWDVHTLAYGLMLLVIVSGFWGMCLYATLPRALSDNRGEVTEPMMLAQLATLDRQMDAAAQPLAPADAEQVRRAMADDPLAAGAFARLTGWYGKGATAEARVALAHDPAIAEMLDRRIAMLKRMRRHLHLKAFLESWLVVHIPATFALIAALTAHIIAVFFYW